MTRAWSGSGDVSPAPAALSHLRRILASGEHPCFAHMVEEAERHPDRDAVFTWQLDRVLDGLAAVLPLDDGPGH
ncbi:hypothetical protein GCM10027294_47560 [Marinactinospora endophytica]